MVAIQNILQDLNFGIFGEDSTSISGLAGIVDIYYEENHDMKVTKTKYPIETGSNMSDHFVVEPETLVLKGLVSDLQPFPEGLGLVKIQSERRSKEAWGRIRTLKNRGNLVTVVTLLGIYENMLILGADATMSKDSGRSLSFTISLEETQIAETKTASLPPAKLSVPVKTKGSDEDGGKKQSEEPEDTSVFQDAIKWAGGFFN